MSDDSFADFRQADGRFAKGNLDGPGRPRARDRMAALDRRVAEASDELIETPLTATKARQRQGGRDAAQLYLARAPQPAGRDRGARNPWHIRLVPAMAAITNAALNGDVTSREGAAAARVIQAHWSVIDLVDLEQRMMELEEEGARQRAVRR